jgi:branched-chain amino acid transport system substrate-binding protein
MSWFRPTARLLAFGAMCAGFVPTAARAVEPITIGFDIELTGGIAPLGKASLLAIQIWTEEINANGGLLGRPVKLVFYDDQSNPALVPGIVTKLLDVDKVDVLLGEVGTNMIAPAMPMVM